TISKVEEALHSTFLRRWGIDLDSQEMSPTNIAYTSFLLRVACLEPFPEVISAILPCYWVYMHMGGLLSKVGSPVTEYNAWISTYGGKEYEDSVKWIIATLDKLDVSKTQEDRMLKHFRLATIYEYLFWDSATKNDKFPFPQNVNPSQTV
ncbi:MAG: thiaminase II, partial [Thermoprotei archaeon]